MLNNGCYACSEVQPKWPLQNYYTSVYVCFVYWRIFCHTGFDFLCQLQQVCHCIKIVKYVQPLYKIIVFAVYSFCSVCTHGRVCIHSKCPVENYGKSTVFTPSYQASSLNGNNAGVVAILLFKQDSSIWSRGGIAICSIHDSPLSA